MRWESVKALGVGALISALAVGIAFAPSQPSPQSPEHLASARWDEITTYGKAKTPVVVAEFRGEADLEQSFKDAVEKSLTELERTSCGLVKITVRWDFNPSKDMLHALLRSEPVIMSVKGDTMKAAFDGEDEQLLGLAHPGAKWVFIVTDRIDDPETADWVAAHEFGHIIGLKHVQLGLMQDRAPSFPNPVATWERDDLREFCSVWGCQIEMFEACRNR